MSVRLIPILLGELIGHRTGGRTRLGSNPPAIDFDSWGYSTDWTMGTPHARQRQPGASQVSQPGVERMRGGLIKYNDEEMSIYARRPRP